MFYHSPNKHYAFEKKDEYTVTELTNEIKTILANNLSFVKINGEVSGLKVATSGHLYFTLKDSDNIINAVCYNTAAQKLNIAPEDGMQVIAYGEITNYGKRSEYQIKVQNISFSGIGQMMKIIEARKQKLNSMGIFNIERKRIIPPSYAIKNIGIITSKQGAVLHDMLHRISERYRHNIILCPVSVQGSMAAKEVMAAITYLNNAAIKPDVIIVARGGGSVEDLFCFNDEALAMCVFNSVIPIISAIGHETDTTIIDMVADLRCPTPTAAAEVVTSPTMNDLMGFIAECVKQQQATVRSFIEQYRSVTSYEMEKLTIITKIIADKKDLVAVLSGNIANAIALFINNKKRCVLYEINKDYIVNLLHNIVNKSRYDLQIMQYQISNMITQIMQKKKQALTVAMLDIEQFNYEGHLKHGLAIVKDSMQCILNNADKINTGDEIFLQMHSSVFKVKVISKTT
jgi:exodeoxyribonuclease VII large subunit